MKKACALLSVLLCCSFVFSCSKNPTESITPKTLEEAGSISAGDHILFGKYPQKSGTVDPEPIEWRVLEVKDGKALLISEYLLDSTEYYHNPVAVTWETSSLREWLNGTFYDAAFSESEMELIQTVTIENPDNPVYGTPGGNNTEDKVFCLSLEEAQIYFTDIDDRKAAPTEYAISHGAETGEDSALDNGMKTGWWCLRSPASSADRAADVDCYGHIDTEANESGVDGDMVFAGGNSVRPVIMISIPAVI